MKAFKKLVLSTLTAATAMVGLAGCNFAPKDPVLENPKNLSYDHETQLFTWDEHENAENFHVVYRIYDSEYYADEEKNYVKLNVTENKAQIVLDPETADGDKISLYVTAGKEGKNGYIKSYTSSLDVIVEGKDHKDYQETYDMLKSRFQILINRNSPDGETLKFKKILQMDHDINTNLIHAKVLATDEEEKLFLYMFQLPVPYGCTVGNIQAIKNIAQKGVFSWRYVYRDEVQKDTAYDRFSNLFESMRYTPEIGSAYAGNAELSNVWQYMGQPNLVDDKWHIFLYGELLVNYKKYDFKYHVRYDLAVVFNKTEQLQTPEQVVNQFLNVGKISGILPINRNPSQTGMGMGISRHVDYFNKHFVNQPELDLQSDTTSSTVSYTFVLPTPSTRISAQVQEAQKSVANKGQENTL